MHQLPVRDFPSADKVKNESVGYTANGSRPSRDNSTRVGVPVTKPTVTTVEVPFKGRFGAPATASDTTGGACVVTESGTDCAETFPAASTAETVKEYAVLGESPMSELNV